MTDNPALRKAIARAVLDDLEDRRDVKQPLRTIRAEDPEIYAEIEAALGEAVMRVLAEAGGEAPEIPERLLRAELAADCPSVSVLDGPYGKEACFSFGLRCYRLALEHVTAEWSHCNCSDLPRRRVYTGKALAALIAVAEKAQAL